MTFHQFDFFPVVVLLSYVESVTQSRLPSASLAQSNLAGSCRLYIFHHFSYERNRDIIQEKKKSEIRVNRKKKTHCDL